MAKNGVVAHKGGLGNQLFQWTFAHFLLSEEKHDRIYWASIHPFNLGKHGPGDVLEPLREFCDHQIEKKEQNNFLISKKFLIGEKLWEIKRFRQQVERLFGYYREDPREDVEQSLPGQLKRARNYSGYFQNSQFLKKVEGQIEKELIPTLLKKSEQIFKRYSILNYSYRSMHIRTGDYYNTSQTNPLFIGRLSDEYYRNAAQIDQGLPLIILCPEKESVRDLIDSLEPDLVLTNVETNHWEVLAIMSKSKTFIGGNSSLSWWGAQSALWNHSNHVYLPNQWSNKMNISTENYFTPEIHELKSIWKSK